jgi:hypothetical protein
MNRRWPWTAIAAACGVGFLLLAGPYLSVISTGYLPYRNDAAGGWRYGPVRVEADNRPAFAIDPAQPWQIALGRGSGWHGLNTVRLDHSG